MKTRCRMRMAHGKKREMNERFSRMHALKNIASRTFAWTCVLLVLGLFSERPLCAQDTPEPPRSSEAGVVETRVREDAREQLRETQGKPAIEMPSEEETTGQAEVETRFFVREILVLGNEAISLEELRPLIAPYEGRELTLNEAKTLAAAIQQAYRAKGYITTLVDVPPQRVEQQQLTIEVLEGRLGRLTMEGQKWFSEDIIRRYWHLEEGTPLRYEPLAASLRRMNENPDREVRAGLRPGESKGFTDVHLVVKDQAPWHGSFSYDNRGTKFTGRRRYGVTLRHNNWLIPDATAVAGAVFGKAMAALYGQYLVPVTTRGTKAILGYTHSWVAPGGEFESSDIRGDSQSYTASLRQAVRETDLTSLHVDLGFELKDSRTVTVDGLRRRDRLRVVRTGFDFTQQDKWGATSLSNKVSFGLTRLGAMRRDNPLASRARAVPNFFKIDGTVSRSLRLPWKTQAVMTLDYQFVPDRLPSAEQLYLGGAQTVRGYPEGDYLADKGGRLTVEYIMPLFVAPVGWKLPNATRSLRDQIQIVAFADQAYGRLRTPSVDEVPSRYLLGVGGGLRIRFENNVFARVEFAHVLGNEPLANSDHTRFHFILQSDI